jgi:ABC-type Fe3+-siderophore transport system permease subunit
VLPLTHGRPRAFVVHRRPMSPADPRLPDAFVGIVAFGVTLVVAVVVAAASKDSSGRDVHWGAQLAVMAIAVGLVCWWCRPLTSLLVALCGWLMLNGLVVHADGQLGWAGREDVVRIGVLVAIGFAMALARNLDVERHQLATRSMSGLQGDHHA